MSEEEHLKKVERIAIELNTNGLSYLAKQNEQASAFAYFKQSEKLLLAEMQVQPTPFKISQLSAVTYNNLAVYYKKTHKPKAALTYLKKAIQIETCKLGDWLAAASTHLNICATYSSINRHQEAIEHAKLAVEMAQRASKELDQKMDKAAKEPLERASENAVLGGKYNLAIEYEHLKNYKESLSMFEEAKQQAKEAGSHIYSSCEEGVQRVKETIRKNEKKIMDLLTKKKENEEKGHYEAMRRNKKNCYPLYHYEGRSDRLKKYDIYNERPAQSTGRMQHASSFRKRGVPAGSSYQSNPGLHDFTPKQSKEQQTFANKGQN